MGSLRAGRALNALSQGFGLFAEKSMKDEQSRLDREWELTLTSMRDEAASRRQQAGFEHSEALAKQQDDSANARFEIQQSNETERYLAGTKATAQRHEETLTAQDKRAQQTRVDKARASLQDTLLTLNKEQAKELENSFDAGSQNAILERYTDLKDQAILGTVSWLSSQNLPGYQVKDEDGLRSLLIQSGMDIGGASQHAKQIWPQIGSGASSDSPVRQESIARGNRAEADLRFLTDPELVERPLAEQPQQAGAPMPPSVAAPSIAAPGSQQLFEEVPNPLGGPPIPTQTGPSFMEFLNRSPVFNKEVKAKNREISEQFLINQRNQ